MKTRNVRSTLRAAHEALETACEADPAVETQLRGIAEQLHYAAEGGPPEPEAVVSIERGALDTIQRRVTEVLEEADGGAAEPLREAREQLLLAIVALDDQWRAQHAGPAGDG